MLGHSTRWIACLAVFAGFPLGTPAQDAPAPPPSPQIVLLRNGQVLEGQISQADGQYVVQVDGGQIRLKATDVEMLCGSLEEGYQRKRAAILVGSVHQHLELAQWCLRHGLLDHAGDEINAAVAADPRHPMIPALQQRLKMALEPPPAPEAKASPNGMLTNEDLDRMVRGLPRGAVETFTQSVQPVLTNHCATSGCHGPQTDNGLRLYRIPPKQTASRRLTQRNLASALEYINRDNPEQSRLLTAASSPHGTARGPIFSEHQATQYKRLVEWANQVAQRPPTDVPASVTPQVMEENPAFVPPATSAAAHPRMLSPEARRARPLQAQGNAPRTAADGPRSASAAEAKPADNPPGEASPASHSQADDPFNPDVFNRQHAPKK